jgi:hypothetical protein
MNLSTAYGNKVRFGMVDDADVGNGNEVRFAVYNGSDDGRRGRIK